ncbi:hypothetical protein [Actinophytocola sp.]
MPTSPRLSASSVVAAQVLALPAPAHAAPVLLTRDGAAFNL